MASHPIFAGADQARVARQWESWLMPHRTSILLALHTLHAEWIPPLKSVYELGCGAGPNLRLIQSRFPELELGGSEPVEAYRTFASDALGLPIEAAEFPTVPQLGTWDVLLTCYAFAYTTPSIVFDTLCAARDTSTRALIILEPTGGVLAAPVGHPSAPGARFWDYRALLGEAGWTITWAWPILPSPDGLNVCLIAERG